MSDKPTDELSMKNIAQIVAEVEAEELALRDADLALHHELNRQMNWVFGQLNSSLIQSRFDHPNCDHRQNGIDIEVSRGGQPVCWLLKSGGKMEVKVLSEGGADATFDNAEDAIRKIVQLLVRHQREYSIELLQELSRPGGWMAS